MGPIIKSGEGFLYMKVGTHAQESLDEIIARKRKEIEDAGYALWGYGGNTCHPTSMVQPFARDFQRRFGTIYLCMEPMNSKHSAPPVRADEYSIDGVEWKKIPPPINVRGSRYALAIRNLRREHFNLSLACTKVAIGNSMGTVGSQYIAGRVDKACLEALADPNTKAVGDQSIVHIELVAELASPYAVFVRNLP